MKRFIPAMLAVVLIGSTVSNAHALGAYLTWWNLDTSNQDGFGVGVREPIKIVPMFSIDTRAAFVNFSGDDDMKVFPIEAVGILSLGLFYGGLGVGYYFFDSGNDAVDVNNSFGWHVLAGISLGLKAVSVFGEIKWTELEADVEDINPSAGSGPNSLDAAGVGFNVGVLFGL